MEHSNCPICNSSNVKLEFETMDFFLTQEKFNVLSCINCRTKYTDFVPRETDIGRYYESIQYLSHTTNNKSFTSIIYKAIKNLQITRKFLFISKLSKKGKLLEIGSGNGELLNIFKKGEWDVYSVEKSEKERNLIKEKFNIDVFEDYKQVKDSKFDVIMLWHVLEHIHDIHNLSEWIYKNLNKGGKLILALPNCNSWDAKYYKEMWAGWDVPRHIYHFGKDTIINLEDKYKLKFKMSKPMIFDSFYVSLLSEKYRGKKGLSLWFHAFASGLRSNISAMKSGDYSSMIYVFEKHDD